MRRTLLTAAACGVLAACAAEAEPATPQEVVFTATDYAFAGPDTIRPGVTTIRMDNHGASPHHLILGRFEDGYGMQDLQAFADTNPMGEPPFVTWRGAVGTVSPHAADASTADLPAGNYVLICFIPDSAGTPHMMHGMIRQMVVTGERHEAPIPEAAITIRMSDFTYNPLTLTAGTHTIRVINDGPQTHEAQLVRLHEGATIEQFLGAMAPGAAGPPPGEEIGGSGALSPGLDNYWTVTLTPGSYAIICFVPDPSDGMPHAMKGMVQTFTVPAS